MKHLLPMGLALVSALSLSQCAHSDKKPGVTDKAALRTEWYIASKDPLTYCPKGHTPAPNNRYDPPLYVSLADGKTRFYIPRGDVSHMQQALAWRNASLPKGVHGGARCWRTAGTVVEEFPATAAKAAVTVAVGAVYLFGELIKCLGYRG